MSFGTKRTIKGATILVTHQQLCEYLEWDSDFFRLRIGRVNEKRLSDHLFQEILTWSKLHSIDCLYFLADCDHYETHAIASEFGFNLVDIRVALSKSIGTLPEKDNNKTGPQIRLSQPEDLVALRDIARSNFRASRFYTDPGFPDELCDALYETWIENESKGLADAVFVIQEKDDVIGFITCRKLPKHKEGQISLVGVSRSAQGHGYGTDLVHHALGWFNTQGITTVEVVTQGRNIKALRLYERCGFTISGVDLWYHKWFSS